MAADKPDYVNHVRCQCCHAYTFDLVAEVCRSCGAVPLAPLGDAEKYKRRWKASEQKLAEVERYYAKAMESLRRARDCCARPAGVCFDPTLIGDAE